MILKPAPEKWRFTFTPTPGDPVPAANRVRRMLKYALRACGLRVIDSGFEPAGIQVPPVAKADACKDEPPF